METLLVVSSRYIQNRMLHEDHSCIGRAEEKVTFSCERNNITMKWLLERKIHKP